MKNENSLISDFNKVIEVIYSCESHHQLDVAYNLVDLFYAKHNELVTESQSTALSEAFLFSNKTIGAYV